MKTKQIKNQKKKNENNTPNGPGKEKSPGHPKYRPGGVITNQDDKLPSGSGVTPDSSKRAEGNETKHKDKNLTDSEVATQKP